MSESVFPESLPSNTMRRGLDNAQAAVTLPSHKFSSISSDKYRKIGWKRTGVQCCSAGLGLGKTGWGFVEEKCISVSFSPYRDTSIRSVEHGSP